MKQVSYDPLLTRAAFRDGVLTRDKHACVICGARAKDGVRLDAHHILERRLWDDGGYYLSNGATLCDKGPGGTDGCHMKAETTELSVEDVRRAAGIDRFRVPDTLYPDHVYDKWGNAILANEQRTKGSLFHDESVQKVLVDRLHLFTNWVKYPRTWHLPWSPGATSDDRILKDTACFEGRDVVVTVKMDGENFSGYRDYCHARSVDGRSHPTRDWAKAFWAQRAYEIPDGWRVISENLYAQHSLRYDTLPGYLMGISIWDDQNACLSWEDTATWFELLDMPHVPVLYEGPWDAAAIRALHDPDRDDARQEGYVVRLRESFSYGNFHRSVAKYVRKNHVQTVKHWMHGSIIEPNGLAENAAPF